jgi:hypothetical protein
MGLRRQSVTAGQSAAPWVSAKLIQASQIADVRALVPFQLTFIHRRSYRH